MNTEASVFEETYQYYLSRIRELCFHALAPVLGAGLSGDRLKIPLFRQEYEIGRDGIRDASGNRPPHDVCVILSRYVLMCPQAVPEEGGWASFRDLKDAGPLTTYFANDVEGAVRKHFCGRLPDLQAAGRALGGHEPGLDVDYDIAMRFDALPRVPLLLLYNEADEEFPASCSVLFKYSVEAFLDAECIAMLGWQLFNHLRKAAKQQSDR